MSEKSQESVLGSLPHSRPHRRSDKRAARPATPSEAAKPEATVDATEPKATVKPTTAKATTAKATAKPTTAKATAKPTTAKTSAKPTKPKATRPEPPTGSSHSIPSGTELVGTVVKATAELAEIGLTVGARAMRIALSRLPRP